MTLRLTQAYIEVLSSVDLVITCDLAATESGADVAAFDALIIACDLAATESGADIAAFQMAVSGGKSRRITSIITT